MNEKLKTTPELLLEIEHHKKKVITVGEIMHIFREGGFGLMFIVFAGIPALPFPAVGIATILAIPILFFAIQLLIGRDYLWLPSWVMKKEFETKSLNNMIDKLLPYVKKLGFFLKPRLAFMSSKIGHRVVGFFCMICAFSVALPFPLTNTLPSIAIVIMALGLLERDGIAMIAGIISSIAGLVVISLVYYFGTEFIVDWAKYIF